MTDAEAQMRMLSGSINDGCICTYPCLHLPQVMLRTSSGEQPDSKLARETVEAASDPGTTIAAQQLTGR
jgi:hypothetical protein